MSQAENWGRIGGHAVLDLVDTISWRYDDVRRIDRTPDFPRLVSWALDRDVITSAEAAILRSARTAEASSPADAEGVAVQVRAKRATTQIHQLRTAVTQLVDPSRDSPSPGGPHGEVLRAQLREALGHAETASQLPLRWLITIQEPQDLGRRLAIMADEFLREPHPGLRVCAGPGCGWVFIDTSKNHSRRWCDPADCGNRVRVARHTQSHR